MHALYCVVCDSQVDQAVQGHFDSPTDATFNKAWARDHKYQQDHYHDRTLLGCWARSRAWDGLGSTTGVCADCAPDHLIPRQQITEQLTEDDLTGLPFVRPRSYLLDDVKRILLWHYGLQGQSAKKQCTAPTTIVKKTNHLRVVLPAGPILKKKKKAQQQQQTKAMSKFLWDQFDTKWAQVMENM